MTGTIGLLAEILDVGRDARRGGYSRHVFDPAERELRDWFVERATSLGLAIETDRNGNIWAWWGQPGANAVVTGSHLDSVPGGGAFDGPLGVASALDAVAQLQLEGFTPTRPFAVMVFAEEEGSRFGVACLGSRLLTGAIDPTRAGALTDASDTTFADAARDFGLAPEHFGVDREALSRIGVFVELHVEQGRGLIELDRPVGVASSILAHGRWMLRFAGQGNHAGTTAMSDRHDPMLAAAGAVIAARAIATAHAGSRATVGRLEPLPGGTNVIASQVGVWLDVRADRDADARAVVGEIAAAAADAADAEGCAVEVAEESYSSEVHFDQQLRDRIAHVLGDARGDAPLLPTGAGHDAGVLAAHVPTAMLFVRNPSGISHAPQEFARDEDAVAGADALVTVLKELL
ncbi:allantoate amidohydrolase [Rathayibacter soli]|uniref:allantoate amidohydrolase n=1 Tax=Rathayibacter soli TaxID=3144168 RepID=UPI0027E3C59F|nr:allantoate amidohydrolase [Glaciibacter superstes]